MANENIIDELQLKVKGSANDAFSTLDKLQTKLRHTAKSIGTVSASAKSLDGVGLAFRRLESIKTDNLSRAITELERLSKIDLKNIKGKDIEFKFVVTGADEVERKKRSITNALHSIDTDALAKKFNEALGLKGVDATRVKKTYQDALKDLANGGNGAKAFGSWASDSMKNGIQIAKSAFMSDVDAMKDEYKQFIDYISQNKIKIDGRGERQMMRENTSAYEYMKFFTSKKPTTFNDDLEELKGMFPSVLTSVEQLDSAGRNATDVYENLLASIRQALEAIQRVDTSNLQGENAENAFNTIMSSASNAQKELQGLFDTKVQQNMEDLKYKIPLDVAVDKERIKEQIASAIAEATDKKYPLPVKFAINPNDIKAPITAALGDIDISSMGNMVNYLKEASTQMASIGHVDTKSSGLNTFVNSLRKLSEADMSKFDATPLKDIVGVVNSVAGAKDISGNINRFIASLAKLASVSEITKTSGKNIKFFGTGIKNAARQVQGIGSLSPPIVTFTSSLASLANAGNKTTTTADNLSALGTAMRQFLADMQGAPEVSENLLRMTEALGVLASSGGKAGTAAKSIGKSISSMGDERATKAYTRLTAIVSIVEQILKVFEKAGGAVKRGAEKIINALKNIKNSSNGLEKASHSIRNMIAAMIGFRGISGLGNMIKETIQLGAALTEIDHIVESVFGEMSGYVDNWAKGAIEKFGIAEHSAKQYAGVLSSMFQASNIGYMDAGKMSMDLVELAGDLSAFYNIDTETAFNKIRSGMAGMVRPLRDLGIDLTAATLDEFRLAQGITTSYSAMSQAEKVMLRYKYLMENTKTQQGDFARTSLSLANSLRTLKAYVQAVGTQIGVGLGAAIRHVIILLNTMMKYILKAATLFASFMQTIFGKYKGGASGIAMEGLGDAADYADDLSGAAGDAADGLGSAADSAEKLKKDLSVLPFDELNQLNKDQEKANSGSGGSGGSGGTGGVGGGLSDGTLDWGDTFDDLLEGSALRAKINAWATQLKKDFLMHDWEALGADIAGGLNKGLQKVYDLLDPKTVAEKVDPWLNAFTTTFNSFVKSFDFNLLGRTVGRGINDVVHILNTAIEGIDWINLGSQIATGVNGLFDEVDWDGLGNLVGNKFMILWNTLNGFVHDFGWAGLGTDIATFFNGVFDKVDFDTIGDTIATGLDGAFTSLASFTAGFDWTKLVHKLASGINTFIRNFSWKENGKKLNDFLQHLADALVDFVAETDWEGLGNGIADFLAELEWADILSKVADAMMDALGGLLKGLCSTKEGKIFTGIVAGLAILKFAHSDFALFAGNLVRAITGKTFTDLLKGGFQNVFSKGVKEAAKSETVTEAATTAASSFGSKITSGLKSIITKVASAIATALKTVGTALANLASNVGTALSTFAGTTLGQVSIGAASIVALTYGTAEAQKLVEVARGGNGVLTDFGSAVEDIIGWLAGHGKSYDGLADELWELKEAAENAGTPVAEVYQMVAEKLGEYGLTAEEVNQACLEMYETSGLNEEAFRGIAAAAEEMNTGVSESAETTRANINTIKDTLWNLADQGGDTSTMWIELWNSMGDSLDTAYSTKEAYDMVITALDGNEEAIAAFKTAFEESTGLVMDDSSKMAKTVDSDYKSIAKSAADSAGSVLKSHQSMEGSAASTASAFGFKLGEMSNKASDFAGKTKESMESSTQSVQQYEKDAKTSLDNNDKDFSNLSSNSISAMVKIAAQTLLLGAATTAMKTLTETNLNSMETNFTTAFGNITTAMNTLSSDLTSGFSTIETTVSNAMKEIQNAVKLDLYWDGANAAQTFANGFQSIHIPTPYLYVSAYQTLSLGHGASMTIPWFGVQWYKAGGLFSGGDGQIIGIAEGGKDEAVLPLEDRKAMARIGSAIADASGSNGGLSDDVIDKLAERIADVVMATKDDNSNQMLYVEVKTENDEVLARAVTRGQKKLDYRNNPTPQFSY